MPSRAERVQVVTEWALRAVAIVALAWVLWAALTPAAAPVRTAVTGDEGLSRRLGAWAADPPDRITLTLRSTPGRAAADLLAGLRRSGTDVSWRDDGIPASAVEVVPRADPLRGATVLVAAPDSAGVALSDALGPLDSATAAGGGVAVDLPAGARGRVQARIAAQVAADAARDSIPNRPLLVLGRAGWESRFVMRALEERGWVVDARLNVAPGLDVSLGDPAAPDTSRYAAVVALDGAAAAQASAIARYVRSGGGLVLGPDAAADGAFRALAVGTVGTDARVSPLAAVVGGLAELETRPIGALRPTAVAIDGSGGRITVAGWRVAAGRVVQIAYPETWRWRMAGRGDSPAAHRAWWSDLVASAAYRPAIGLPTAGRGADPAPLSRLHDRLGHPSSTDDVDQGAPPGPRRPPWWIAGLIFAALAGEWGSRRTRGAR